MQKYNKSLVEVWEWKEKVYQKVKDLSIQEYIEKVRKDAGFRDVKCFGEFTDRE